MINSIIVFRINLALYFVVSTLNQAFFFSFLLFRAWYKNCLYEKIENWDEIEFENSTSLKFKIFNIANLKISEISKSNSKSIVDETSNYRILARILKYRIFIFFKSIFRNLEFSLKNFNDETNVDLNWKVLRSHSTR